MPYDSPNSSSGDARRPFASSQRTMKSRNSAASRSTPQKLWFVYGAIASDQPLPTASTNTRSEVSSSVSALSTSGNGVGALVDGSPVASRFGPKEPRCSQTVAEPGPPL